VTAKGREGEIFIQRRQQNSNNNSTTKLHYSFSKAVAHARDPLPQHIFCVPRGHWQMSCRGGVQPIEVEGAGVDTSSSHNPFPFLLFI
jgi:hypothetical protein